jgi:hypothetical protein
MWKSCGRGFFKRKHDIIYRHTNVSVILGQLEYFPLSSVLEQQMSQHFTTLLHSTFCSILLHIFQISIELSAYMHKTIF